MQAGTGQDGLRQGEDESRGYCYRNPPGLGVTVGFCPGPIKWLRALETSPLPASSPAAQPCCPLAGPVISGWVYLRTVQLAKGQWRSWLLPASRGWGWLFLSMAPDL